MAFSVSSLMALVMIFSSPISSTSCYLPQSLDLRNQETFTALDQMKTISLLSCLKYRSDFKFPQEKLDGSQFQKAQAISVLYEMLQQIFDLFHTERSSAAWNTTLLDNLCTGLHRQLEDLDTCLEQETGEEGSALGTVGPTLAVKRYFRGLHLYLKEKKYSDCAWEMVRVEIRRHFLFINELIRKLRK
ncbi:interferon omega-1-like [Diceros bicornis minor]|uniref:interferon omega-1-like n=1 Tax=Diceros bicornis minor TaxID=77932 RepID=UPI0026EC6363|nr:interferon omega-1-like [Diceros bicornis minor]